MDFSAASFFELKIVPEVQMLWDELGLDDGERSNATDSLSKDLAQICLNFHTSLVSRCAEVRRDISAVKDKHRRALRAFGVSDSDIARQISSIGPTNLIGQLLDAKQSLHDFEREISERVQTLEGLAEVASELFDALGVPFDERGEFGAVGDSDLTSERVERFRVEVARLQCEREERLTKRALVTSDVSVLLTDLDSIAQGDDLAVLNSESVSPDQIDKLCALRDRLEKRISERVSEVSALAVAITQLWDLLAVDENERLAFLRSHTSLGDDVLASCQEEIARLTELRDERLPELIAAQRAEVRELWELMHIAMPQGVPGTRNELQEFGLLQQEIIRLKTLLVECRPIMEAVQRREEILQEYNEMMSQMQDSNRLTSRGRGGAQQRMREEKARRRYYVSLPKLEKKLYQLLADYRSKTGTEFEWDGKPYLESLARTQGKEKAKTLPQAQCRVPLRTIENVDAQQELAWLLLKQPS
jgi:hypothetical protein